MANKDLTKFIIHWCLINLIIWYLKDDKTTVISIPEGLYGKTKRHNSNLNGILVMSFCLEGSMEFDNCEKHKS